MVGAQTKFLLRLDQETCMGRPSKVARWYPSVGERVMLKIKVGQPYGKVVGIDGAYIAVRPLTWPKGSYIFLYLNEIGPCQTR